MSAIIQQTSTVSGGGGAITTTTRTVSVPVNTAAAAGPKKVLYLIRHGQGVHNVLYESGRHEESHAVLDPSLTEVGFQQAKDVAADPLLQKALHGTADEKVQLVVVSPLRRTLQTAIGAFGDWLLTDEGAGVPMVAHADIQETGEVDCDSGRPLSVVRGEFTEDYLDWGEVSEHWNDKSGINRDNGPCLLSRLNRFRRWLASRPEERVALVAHHNVFLALTQTTFLNCEVRSYDVDGVAWTPKAPVVSVEDAGLSAAELKHEGIYHQHNADKLAKYGIPAPARFR